MDITNSKKSTKRNIYIVLVSVIGGLVAGYLLIAVWFNQTKNNLTGLSGRVEVVLTEQGYQPEVTIKKGTTVVFKNELDNPYWPAANLHPSHELYSDFDPKRPLAPDETWSFTFDRVGVWDMHDHIRSYYTGSITVVE